MSQFTGRKHIVCDGFELNGECHRVIHQGSIFFLCVGQLQGRPEVMLWRMKQLHNKH